MRTRRLGIRHILWSWTGLYFIVRCLRVAPAGMRLVIVALLLLTLAPAGAPAVAQLPGPPVPAVRPLGEMLNPDGTLDLSSGWSGGLETAGWAMATGPDGEPRFFPTGTQAQASTWDDRFGEPGLWNCQVYAVAVSGSNVYIGGDLYASPFAPSNIIRWNGRRWYPLGEGVNGDVKAIAVQGSDVYVGGEFTVAGGVAANGIARWDGSAWSAVGSGVGTAGGYSKVHAIAVSGTQLYIGGGFTSVDGVAANRIARWNGTSWSPLGQGVTDEVYALALDGNRLYVGGNFSKAGTVTTNSIAAWDGNNWAALGSGMAPATGDYGNHVAALAVYDGTLYAGGVFGYAGGVPANSIARWNGTAWQALGAGLRSSDGRPGDVRAVAVSGGSVYAGGKFDLAGGTTALNLAAWNGAAWSQVGGGVACGPTYNCNRSVSALARRDDGGLYVGGNFDTAGDMLVYNIARWDSSGWTALGQGLDAWRPQAVAVSADGQVYIGGYDLSHAGGHPANSIAVWDGQTWAPLAEGVEGTVSALVMQGDNLYVGGGFSKVGQISANNIARWNRVSRTWSPLGSGINGPVYALALGNGILYAGGNFTSAGSASATDLAWWDGAQWHPFGATAKLTIPNGGSAVNALAVAGDLVFVGGDFWDVSGIDWSGPGTSWSTRVNSVAAWDRSTDDWYLLGGANPGVKTAAGHPADVYALAIVGNDVYVGGEFVRAGVTAVNGIARWSAVSDQWFALGDSVGGVAYPEVHALHVMGGGLYVGGYFTAAGPANAAYIARWNLATHTYSALGQGLALDDYDEGVFGLASWGENLYVVGSFSGAGGNPSVGFARWGPPLPPSASATVTRAAGGVLTVEGFSITFPPNAVSADVTLTYQGLVAPSAPMPARRGAARSFTLEARTAGGQVVTAFDLPYTMQLDYTNAELAGGPVKEAGLNLLYRSGNQWLAMLPCQGCSLNTTANRLTVVADHFTEFALAGEQEQVYLPVAMR